MTASQEQADAHHRRATRGARVRASSCSIENMPIETPAHGTRLVTTKRLPILGDDGEPQYLLGVIEDVTERQQRRGADRAYGASRSADRSAEPRGLQRAPGGDARKGGAGGRELRRASASTSTASRRSTTSSATSIGDELLREVSRRLQEAAGGAFLARLGGDEFTLIVTDGTQPGERRRRWPSGCSAAVADDSTSTATQLRIGLSIGVAIYPADGADATTLIGNADAALYRAKAKGRGTICFFEADMDQRLRERRALQHELRIGDRARRARPALPAAGADRRRDHRLRGAGALAPSDPRPGPARRRSSRSPRKAASIIADRRMDPARGLPRGGVLAAARCRSRSTSRRSSSATATCPGWCIRCCWKPG